MKVSLVTPSVSELPSLIATLSTWQEDRSPIQLHPGDIGWHAMRGLEVTASHLRAWQAEDSAVLAIGMFDGDHLLRLALSPSAAQDREVCVAIARDLTEQSESSLFPPGQHSVESRRARMLDSYLGEHGWERGELWTALHFDLSAPVEFEETLGEAGLRVESAIDLPREWMIVHRSGFHATPYTPEEEERAATNFQTMVDANLVDARHLAMYQGDDMVGVVSVWSAGVGCPGLLEPLAIHPRFRGLGFGRILVRAAMGHLREMGASSGLVCTDTANTAAIATYRSAGFVADEPVADWVLADPDRGR